MKAPIAIPGRNPAAKDLPLKSDPSESDSVGLAPSSGALPADVGVASALVVLLFVVEAVVEDTSELVDVGVFDGFVGAASALH
jgi:hypothetical protein